MANIVLVHGAWFGTWCWKRVVPRLQSLAHDVHTVTLTGLGERSHLLTPEVGLHTHVDDVVNLLEFQDLQEVVLVGHSYAGMVVGCASHRVPERIARLVYLDAYVPEHGKSFFDLQASRFREILQELARVEGEGWKIPALDPNSESLGVTEKGDVEWLRSKLTVSEKSRAATSGWRTIAGKYSFETFRSAGLSASRCWIRDSEGAPQSRPLSASRLIMVTVPAARKLLATCRFALPFAYSVTLLSSKKASLSDFGSPLRQSVTLSVMSIFLKSSY